MFRQVPRALALALVLALGVLAVPFAFAAPDAAKRSAQPRQSTTTTTTPTAATQPPLPKRISRACGKSRGDKRVRTRRSTRPTASTVTTTTTYCSGRTTVARTKYVTEAKTETVTVTVPVAGPTVTQTVTTPAPPAPPAPPVDEVPVPQTLRLTLLHNNDGESKYATGDSVIGYGGVARFKTVVDRLRAEADAFAAPTGQSKETVVISSGDNFLAGSGFTAGLRRNQQTGAPFYDSLALNAIGYDAATLGNHEYDFGPNVLATFIEGTSGTFPFLAANVDTSGEPALARLRAAGRIAGATIVRKAGQQIGVIGVSPPELKGISSPGNVVVSQFTAGVVNNEVRKLTDQGVNKIILSSHLQDINAEKALVPQLHGVDIVIGGGGDNLLASEDDVLIPGAGGVRPTPDSPYPTPITDADGVSVPVITTSGEYDYVGRLTATFDDAGKIVSVDGGKSGPVRVSGTAADPDVAPEDTALKQQVVDPITAFKAALAANIIGTTQDPLDGGGTGQPVRNRETNLGDVVADGFRYAANQNAVADGRPIAQIAFSNGGGVRVSLPAGNLSEQSTFDVLPFSNFISTVPSVTPAKLKELMEWGVAAAFQGGTLVNNGKFPQISGFKMTVDRTRAAAVVTGNGADARTTSPGDRVRSITLDDGTAIVTNGAVVTGAPTVALATTDFTAGNGDNYPFNLPFVRSTTTYTESLLRFITNSDTVSGLTALNRQITTARYPPAGNRITFVA